MSRETVFVIAGEPSGDLLGARLMAGLRQRRPGLGFAGIGGPRMAAEGLDPLFPIDELAVMGLTEVLPRAPQLLRRVGQTVEAIKRMRPAAVVTIDSPGFNGRIWRRLGDRRFPLIHYVAPSVWAWRPGRARRIAAAIDHLLVLLPFEPPYFEREGLPCSFVGHPIVEGGADQGVGERFRAAYGVPWGAPLICLLPGSRTGEVGRLLPLFRDAADRLATAMPGLCIAVPTVDAVAPQVAAVLAGWRVPVRIVHGDADKYDAFAASRGALAASGTVALELALAGVPAVVAYKLGPITGWIARRLVTTPSVNLVNILLGRAVVPELLQERCTPDALHRAMRALLDDPAATAAQAQAGRAVAGLLGAGGTPPSLRAAEAVIRAMDAGTRGTAAQPRSSSGM